MDLIWKNLFNVPITRSKIMKTVQYQKVIDAGIVGPNCKKAV